MNILNIEDDVYKQSNISRVLKNARIKDLNIDVEDNLLAGVERIEEKIRSEKPYDLIITDMWYPERSGGKEVEAGEKLIKLVKEKGWNIPVILCSSVDYIIPGILGSVYYSEKEEWDSELLRLVKSLC